MKKKIYHFYIIKLETQPKDGHCIQNSVKTGP
jgi:hypothetical protein